MAPSTKTELPIPPALDALVLKCLAKDRDERPKSPRDLLRRLDALGLEKPWDESRAREWWNVHLPA
jgi:hypothetical protein